jgi:two-component system nitrogen regulation response regulator GlnG
VSRGAVLKPEHFPEPVAASGAMGVPERLQSLVAEWAREQVALSETEPDDLYERLIDTIEPALLDEVVQQLGGNRLAAAKRLGLARATVRKMLKKYHPASEETDEDE